MLPTCFEHPAFPDHELLDSGAGEKLERFGPVVLRRPDPQALWPRALADERWEAADLTFVRESDRGGTWVPGRAAVKQASSPEPAWPCRFEDATLVIRPTPFKHVGLFPEQATNWQFVRERLQGIDDAAPRLLNLFGYTGAGSVLAAQAGYSVTHVDASKTSISWTVENAEASGLGRDRVRVICDDALAFAQREVRRGSQYHGILLDPPHYGRGPKGEKWQFESGIAALIEACGKLLAARGFLVLSTYAIGYSPLSLHNLLAHSRGFEHGAVEVGELALPEAGSGRLLPAGFCARWTRAC